MTTVIDVRGLSAGYAGVPAVRGLDLSVQEGEVVALLGPNGAGKTTTLLCISGVLHPLAGELRVLGKQVPAGSPFKTARWGLGHVPEDRAIFFDLTVAENLRLGRRGSAPTDVLTWFPALEPLMGRRAGLLSGGEQQMLALGRALASRPRVLMVDEMSLGLAPIIVEQLLPLLRQIADETGLSVLLVEQHVQLSLEVADRAYVLSHGELVLEGSAEQLRGNRELLEMSYLGEQAS